ncbi:MAG: hypothetical protein IJW69_04510 [Clostridia bacterium]|nr:hypothetical protein [Clostridia bacterium]
MKLAENTLEQRDGSATLRPLYICFVCTGNTCRSPMAEAVFNDMARIPPVCSMCDIERLVGGRPMRATSAGLFATGAPIAANAVSALERAGVRSLADNNYAEHLSRNLDAETVERCDLIVGMTGAHAMSLMAAYPEHASKITAMPVDIPDPYGMDGAAYDACLAAIKKGLLEMFFGEGEHENGNT